MLVFSQSVCICWIQINNRPGSPWLHLDNHVFNIYMYIYIYIYIYIYLLHIFDSACLNRGFISGSKTRGNSWYSFPQNSYIMHVVARWLYKSTPRMWIIVTWLLSRVTQRWVFPLYVTYRWIGEVTFLTIGRGIEDCQFDSLISNGFVQERCNSIANALELHLSCPNPSISQQ